MLAPFPALLATSPKSRPSSDHHPNQPNQPNQPNYPITQLQITNYQLPNYLLLTLTALSLWTMSLRWEVTRLEWPAPVERTIETTLPDRPLINMPFGPEITLAAYELQAGDQLVTTLYWQSQSRPDIPYTVFIHVVDEAGNIPIQQDIMPQNGRLPTTCWQPQEIITDTHELDMTSLEAGQYHVVVGLYDQETATRLGEITLEPVITLLE
jgi:hypothetical protein